MASLKDLRRRIGSVKNTQQITSAMKLVAASKLRRAQQAILGAQPYADRVEELSKRLIQEILASQKCSGEKAEAILESLHPLLKASNREESPKRALVIISSNRGLCGGYNTIISRLALKHYRELVAAGESVELFFFGRKTFDIFRRFQFHGALNEEIWMKPLTTTTTDKVANEIVQKYLSGEFHKIEIIYTEFKSALVQTPKVVTLLPLKVEIEAVAGVELPESDKPFLYEPEREKLLATLLPKRIMTQVYRTFASSYASEVGSRMTAMENATRNAGDMIARLTLLANRTRQAAITTELTEIVGGAEALKG